MSGTSQSLREPEVVDGAFEPPTADGPGPERGLGFVGWARWLWRQLTSMRIALILLFLLSLAAIPGSLVPQRATNPIGVDAFLRRHPSLGPIYDKLGMFHVYSSVWFSAVYLLLFVSLGGCIVPRVRQFGRALRSHPPAAPRNLRRLPVHTAWRTTDAPAEEVLRAAGKALRRRRFRVHASGDAVCAEKGYLREAGNLLFHISLFGLLIAVAMGSLWRYQGSKLIVEGDGFANTLTQYDDFSSGSLYNVDDLAAFGFQLDRFRSSYEPSGSQRGTPTVFAADVTYWTGAGDQNPGQSQSGRRKATIEVNHPLEIGGAKVYLVGHGYAPVVTFRDAQGNIVQRGPVPFLPQDGNFTSSGVIKIQDAQDKNGKAVQYAFQGLFLPTAKIDPQRGPYSDFPALVYPALFLSAYHGDLGTNSGLPQNVYQLDTSHMKQFTTANGAPFTTAITPGQEVKLPGGAGTLTFEGVKQWATFQVSRRPGSGVALASAVVALAGLIGSLFVQRRRAWVRARPDGTGSTEVELGGLARGESSKITGELADLAAELRTLAPETASEPPVPEPQAPEPQAPEPQATEPPASCASPADAPGAPAGRTRQPARHSETNFRTKE